MGDRVGTHGFWFGGARAQRREVSKERRRALAPLEEALVKALGEGERAEIQAKIERVEREFKERERRIEGMLF